MSGQGPLREQCVKVWEGSQMYSGDLRKSEICNMEYLPRNAGGHEQDPAQEREALWPATSKIKGVG